jgi:FlaA1/EpsC-like NDP-sugar epimerase
MARLEQVPHATQRSRPLLLIIGDALAFLLFSAIGRSSHSQAAGLDAIVQVANTAAPFLLGWYIVAPFTGVYRNATTSTPRQMLVRTALTWLIACPVGLVLRAIYLQREIPLSFALVTFGVHLLIMVLWRGGWAWFESRRSVRG